MFSFFNLQQSEHYECTNYSQENYVSWRLYRNMFRHSYLVQQIKRNLHTSNFEGKTISSAHSVTLLLHLDVILITISSNIKKLLQSESIEKPPANSLVYIIGGKKVQN